MEKRETEREREEHVRWRNETKEEEKIECVTSARGVASVNVAATTIGCYSHLQDGVIEAGSATGRHHRGTRHPARNIVWTVENARRTERNERRIPLGRWMAQERKRARVILTSCDGCWHRK